MHLSNPWEHYLNQLPCNYHSPSVPPGPQLICWHLAAFCTSQAFLAGWPAAWQERWIFQKRKKKVNNLRDVLISWDCLTCHVALPASWFAMKAQSITYQVSHKVKYMTCESEHNRVDKWYISVFYRQIIDKVRAIQSPILQKKNIPSTEIPCGGIENLLFFFHVAPIYISKN